MATIYPTASIHYTKSAGDPSQLLAPPYDVIDDDAARTLRDLSPYNAVRLILPEGKAPARYQLAASRLRRWLTEGVLARSDKDALYLYRQEFSHAGSSVARTAILTALELTGFDQGEVLPHERTHAAPKKDRLALMKACRAQLSPVFAIAPDPKGQLQELVARADTDAPILMARTPDDIRHTLWRVPKAVEAPLLRAAAAPAFLIADGHHRYETALQLARDLPERAAAGRVLAAVVGEYDPGLIVQATHRRLTGLPADWLERLTVAFEVESGPEAPDALAAEVGRRGGAAIGVLTTDATIPTADARSGTAPPRRPSFLLRARPASIDAAQLLPAEERLACILFDRLILHALTRQDAEAAVRSARLSYHQDPAEAAATTEGRGAAFLLPPVGLEDLWDVAREGKRLPAKSTYFTPKIPSGLMLRPI